MKNRLIFLIIFVPFVLVKGDAQTNTSSFNKVWLKTIVSVERAVGGKYFPIGTGFAVYTPNNHVALVTAKHVVIDDRGKVIPNLIYRLNEQHGNSIVYEASYPPKYIDTVNQGWFLSNQFDLACRIIVFNETSDIVPIDSGGYLTSNYLDPGANVLILGFPLGLRSEQYANPLVRHGIVARTDSASIVVDALVFPGNSGGPVLYSPVIKIGAPLTSPLINEEKVIGVISSYIPYDDIAISEQTRRPRIVFEENSGLCNVIPIEALRSLLNSKEFLNIDHNLHKYR